MQVIEPVTINGVDFDPRLLKLENASEGSEEEKLYIDYMSESVTLNCERCGTPITTTRCKVFHGLFACDNPDCDYKVRKNKVEVANGNQWDQPHIDE